MSNLPIAIASETDSKVAVELVKHGSPWLGFSLAIISKLLTTIAICVSAWVISSGAMKAVQNARPAPQSVTSAMPESGGHARADGLGPDGKPR